MNYFTVRSRKDPTNTAYKVFNDTTFDYRFRGVCRWAMVYQTYGDGDVQHSAETPFSVELLEDFLGSLACTLADTECTPPAAREEMLAIVAKHWPRIENRKATIRWALSVKYKEGKDTYYCLSDHKTSTAESKRHDKRWDKVHDGMNGTIKSAVGILRAVDCYDTIHMLKAWMEVCDVFQEDNDGWCPVNVWEEFKVIEGRSHVYRLDRAWGAVQGFVDAYRATEDAKSYAASWETHIKPVEVVGK